MSAALLSPVLPLSPQRGESLEEENQRLRAELKAIRAATQGNSTVELLDENKRLREKVQQLEEAVQQRQQDSSPADVFEASSPGSGAANCSESRLRLVMTSQGTTSEQLSKAIQAAEALLEEARRELNARRLRERRFAYERLHKALEKPEENELAAAVDWARKAGVDEADVAQGDRRLAELRALTAGERAVKAARERAAENKKEAFLLVKRDDVQSLKAILDSVEGGAGTWKEWRDYAGRSLWRCAQDLRSERVKELLAPELGLAGHGRPSLRMHVPAVSSTTNAKQREATPPPLQQRQQEKAPPTTPAAPATPTTTTAQAALPPAPATPAPAVARACSTGGLGQASPLLELSPLESSPVVCSDEEERLKAKALRAVVQDDCAALQEVLEQAPPGALARWHNRAGKDLLTLSQERGSASAYSVIARALGVLKEMKREALEEQESVWVFLPGEVQPLRATVLEDTPEDAEDVLLEYWDGDAPPERVERCMVRRIGG